jgi:hypothetical protein
MTKLKLSRGPLVHCESTTLRLLDLLPGRTPCSTIICKTTTSALASIRNLQWTRSITPVLTLIYNVRAGSWKSLNTSVSLLAVIIERSKKPKQKCGIFRLPESIAIAFSLVEDEGSKLVSIFTSYLSVSRSRYLSKILRLLVSLLLHDLDLGNLI